jgi:hypothetical protein
MAGENLLYTYVFSFKPWSDSSSLEEPENCTNRRWQDFNGNNPVLWSDMWARQDLVDSRSLDVSLNSTAVNGDYLTWPTPSLQWSVVVSSTSSASTASGGNGIGIITYNGLFTIAELLSCANTYITESMDDTYFTYRGTFYIILVQPAQKYPGYPDEYATRSYTNPFVFRIPRNVDVVDTDVHNPTEIYSYVSQLAFERYTSSTVSVDEDYYYLHPSQIHFLVNWACYLFTLIYHLAPWIAVNQIANPCVYKNGRSTACRCAMFHLITTTRIHLMHSWSLVPLARLPPVIKVC